ncbi:MAG: serine/threonine protein kinase [Planctomycetota bacterium]|nr:serine/threonine protein kinase [Planctomycetota bacterium]
MANSVRASVLSLLLAAYASPAHAGDEAIAAQGRAFLAKHCFECHSHTRGKKEEVEGVDFADRAALLAHRDGEDDLIVAGKPDASLVWTVVAVEKRMPKKGKPRPSAEEIATLRAWIEAGAEFPAAKAATRSPRGEADELTSVARFLRDLPETERSQWRFFTLRQAYNRPADRVSDLALATLRMGLAKAVNSLSAKEEIVLPRALDSAATILAVDLRSLGWDRRRLWDEMLRHYPYGLVPGDESPRDLRAKAREVFEMTGSEIPIVRADWFIVNATRSPLYDAFLDLPETAGELEDRLGVPVERDFREAMLRRAAVSKSKVSDFNRLVDRHEARHGYYWKSYDFRSEEGTSRLTTHPLGPPMERHPFPKLAFEHAGGEILFSLPNDLQGYLLVDQTGKKIDPGPVDIVHDDAKTAGTPLIVNGLSCMGCHAKGMYQFVDTIRQGVTARGDSRGFVDRLFMDEDELKRVLKKDEARYVAAQEKAVGPFRPASGAAPDEPISAVAGEHLKKVDLDAAAAELDLADPEILRSAIAPKSSRLRALGLGPLIDGGSIRRETWESRKELNSLYQDAAREVGDHVPKTVF